MNENVININADDLIHLKINGNDMQTLMNALSYLPYYQSEPLITELKSQVALQFNHGVHNENTDHTGDARTS